MTTTITSLPNELLLDIFNKIDKPTQLAECRLVCKTWSKLAEREMLGRTIVITRDEAKMKSLYAYLQTNAEKQHLIKHLHFYRTLPLHSMDVIKLIQLALTPSIESISGYIQNPIVYNLLVDIIEGSCTDKLANMKTLRLCHFDYSSPHRLALHCEKTIQTMELRYYSDVEYHLFVNRLGEFLHLTSLELTYFLATIKDLDKILDNCRYLQKLTLELKPYKYGNEVNLIQTTTVKRHPTLKAVVIRNYSSLLANSILEYLLFKLINIEKISVHHVFIHSLKYVNEMVIGIPKVIQGVAQKELIHRVKLKVDAHILSSQMKEAGYHTTVKATSTDCFCIEGILHNSVPGS